MSTQWVSVAQTCRALNQWGSALHGSFAKVPVVCAVADLSVVRARLSKEGAAAIDALEKIFDGCLVAARQEEQEALARSTSAMYTTDKSWP